MDDGEQLRRFRALARAHFPPDLFEWALARIRPHASRNECLRRAGELIGGSRWSQAQAISEAIETFRAQPGWLKFVWQPDLPAHHVQAAVRLDLDTPSGVRQLLRILDDGD